MLNFISSAKAYDLNAATVGTINNPAGARYTTLSALISAALGWIIGVASGLLVIAILYSGILYITSGGDTAKAETAKKNLIWAVTGLIVMLLMYAIIEWVKIILPH